MLETLLNLVWLLISVFGIWGWWRWWSPHYAGNQRRIAQGWMALIVLVFLLFPVISMTDDLHPGPSYLEDSSASKRRTPALRQAAAHRVHSHAAADGVAALPPNSTFAIALLDSGNVVVESSFASSASRLTVSGRSPPAISL